MSQPYQIDYVCPACYSGPMNYAHSINNAELKQPHVHLCQKCGNIEKLSKVYPIAVAEENQNSQVNP